MKKYAKLLLKIMVSFVLLGIIYLKVDKEAILSNLKLLDWRFVPLIIGGLVLNYIFSSIRWKALLIYDNTNHVSVKYLTTLYFIGSFFNNFMPTSIGGDVYKMFKLGKKINNTAHAFSATFMERFTGVLALVFLSVISVYKLLGYEVVLLFIWLGFCFLLGLKVLSFLSGKSAKVKKIYDSLYMYNGKTKVLSFALVTSVLVQLISVFTQFFVFKAIGVDLPILYSLFIFPVIILGSFFIPSLNGLGVQDTMYMNFFLTVGATSELGLSASILFHLFKLSVSLIGGLLYALGKDA